MIFVNQIGHTEWANGIARKGRKGKAQRTQRANGSSLRAKIATQTDGANGDEMATVPEVNSGQAVPPSP
jgi:hypothetical protein